MGTVAIFKFGKRKAEEVRAARGSAISTNRLVSRGNSPSLVHRVDLVILSKAAAFLAADILQR
jgi:hypothetical protein